MANAIQIYNIVNSIAQQALGLAAVEPTNANFISVGNTVLSSAENKDAFYNVLIDRVGRTVVAIRAYHAKGAELSREGFEWGVVLQKLSFKLPAAKKNTTWNALADEHSDPFAKATTLVKQSLFSDFATWEVDGTIPDVQLQTAFTGAEAMAAFIDGIFMSMYNSLELSYENTANLCRAAFIARKSTTYAPDGGAAFINVLDNYNTLTNAGLTVAKCLTDADFLKYATRQISLYVKRFEVMSTIFNNDPDGIERFTPKDEMVLTVLADFSSATASYLEADTYHKELVALPNYTEIPYWQGSGTAYSFDDTSKISVTIDNGKSGEEKADVEIEVSGVLALLTDRRAMGVTIDNRRTKSIYNPKDEYTNYFMKADMGFYNDMSENGVVFYVAEA